MPFANECRDRVLLLRELAEETPEFREQLLYLADLWLTIATVTDLSKRGADATPKVKHKPPVQSSLHLHS